MKAIAMTALVLAAALLATTAPAATTEKDKEDQAQAIATVLSSLEHAFNRGDARAMAALWTPDGEFIGTGGDRIQGRPQIEKHFAVFLGEHKGLNLTFTLQALRLIGKDMAVVDLLIEAEPAPRGVPAEPRSTLVLVRREGQWLIDTARDTLSYVPSSHHHLKELQWLVGEWSDEAKTQGAHVVHSTVDWTANNQFLIRRYQARRSGVAVAGTEVIGWDPRSRRIRSWNFDSSGGFGESRWKRDGNRWIVEYAGVLQDGSEVAATHIVTRVDNDTFTLESNGRTLDGAKQPDLKAVRIKREKAEPGKEPAAPEKPSGKILPR